jgi:hypothetical protein
MNCCRETMKMGVPARHREPARSGEAGVPPGNRRVLVSVPVRYVAGGACPERSRRNTRGRKEGRPYNSRSLRSAQSRKRVPSFVVAASNS